MNIQEFIKKQPPGRLITMGFALVILIGTLLLLLPFSIKSGVTVTPLNALFTATSAVCVTGLVVVDTADTFTAFGQTVIGILIQIGGLGVASAGLGLMIAAGKKNGIQIKDGYAHLLQIVQLLLDALEIAAEKIPPHHGVSIIAGIKRRILPMGMEQRAIRRMLDTLVRIPVIEAVHIYLVHDALRRP